MLQSRSENLELVQLRCLRERKVTLLVSAVHMETNSTSEKITTVLGARTKKEVFFEKIARKLTEPGDSSVKICTDDGSYGIKGTTVDVMSNLVRNNTYDCVYTCGPELMMKGVV